MSYAQHVSTRQTPQSEPIPGKEMTENSAGGHVFGIDCWSRMHRFLILGAEGGSYYATARTLVKENAASINECASQDAARAVRTIVDISREGRAPKNDPAVFAIAMLAGHESAEVRKLALEAISEVCRTGTHLFQFMDSVRHFRGFGRGLKRAVSDWYTSKEPNRLAYQLVKYQSRHGWTHRDVLRQCHAKSEANNTAMRWAVGKVDMLSPDVVDGNELIAAHENAKRATSADEIAKLIRDNGLVRESIPTEFLNDVKVWDALLEKMPMTAMIRNLGKMSSVGLLKPMSNATQLVASRLVDNEALSKARIHPFNVLLALTTYKAGCGVRGSLRWNVDRSVSEALNESFYKSFGFVEPTGKRFFLGLDVSGSMSSRINNTHISCRDASAAMAMTAVRTEPLTYSMAFTSSGGGWGSREINDFPMSKNEPLDGLVNRMSHMPFGGTDCSLPMIHAMEHGIEADVFVVYTDSETWAGSVHPCQALQEYREQTGINAKLIVCGMVSNGFSIADPNDSGMLDVVGFDPSCPGVIAEFVR